MHAADSHCIIRILNLTLSSIIGLTLTNCALCREEDPPIIVAVPSSSLGLVPSCLSSLISSNDLFVVMLVLSVLLLSILADFLRSESFKVTLPSL